MKWKSNLKRSIRKPIQTLRQNFFAGLFVLIPIVAAGWILKLGLSFILGLYEITPSQFKPPEDIEVGLKFISFLGLCFVSLFLISLLGWGSKLFLGQKLLSIFKEVIEKIPILGAIYSSIELIIQNLTRGDKKKFRRVVYIEYPKKGTWAVAFVTGKSQSKALPDNHLNVFVPTVPNPTSGFLLMVPESDVIDSDLGVEEAFRTILSLGFVEKKELEKRLSTNSSKKKKSR